MNNCNCCQMRNSQFYENTISPLPENPTVTMAYVPFQTKNDTYKALEALCQGTLFPCLDKPFCGGSSR